jgi:Region found in RelA / SpoT proteins
VSKFSGKQVVKLGRRLRDASTPTVADLEMLADVLLEYDHALMAAATELQGIGLKPTTRLKTSGTIIEKLSRERHLNLKIIRDLAGARIVRRMTLDEQDQVSAQIMGIWPDAGYIDRRENPSHGYRAIHIVPRIDGCQVEIQLRTEYQDLWAQGMETFGDIWGRAIRYGGEPDDPDDTGSGTTSRRDLVAAWKRQADDLYELAKLENEAARLRSGGSSPEVRERLSALDSEMNSRFVHAKSLVEGLRGIFD